MCAGSLNTLKQSGTLYDVIDHEEDLLWWAWRSTVC